MTGLSTVGNSVLTYLLKDRESATAKDIDKIDNLKNDNQISLAELKSAAKKAGADLTGVSDETLMQDAKNLTQFLQKGGELRKTTTDNVNVFEFKPLEGTTPPSVKDVEANKSGVDGKSLVFQRGQKGLELRKIINLLINNDFSTKLAPKSDSFTPAMENFIKEFQEENGLIDKNGKPLKEGVIAGVIDEKTLDVLIDSAKKEKPYELAQPEQIADSNNDGQLNSFDRVKNVVADQLREQGVDTDKAFKIGDALVSDAAKVEKIRTTDNRCFATVKESVAKGLNLDHGTVRSKAVKTITVNDGRKNIKVEAAAYARFANDAFFPNMKDKFVEIKGLSKADLKYLPAGAVIVYTPKHFYKPNKPGVIEAGHIGVQNGKGRDLSDKDRDQSKTWTSADMRVYFPINANPEPVAKPKRK